MPQELLVDITSKGIWLVGGSSHLRGLDNRFSEKIGIRFNAAKDLKGVVARGAAYLIER